MPIYMKYGDVKGNVSETEHKDWINLTSCQLGVNRRMTNPTGQSTQREGGAASVGEIMISKLQDSSSSNLFNESLQGKGTKVEIHFVETPAGGSPEVYMKVELEQTLVSSYSLAGAGGLDQPRPMETLALNFTEINVTTHLMNPDGTKGDPVTHGWKLGEIAKK